MRMFFRRLQSLLPLLVLIICVNPLDAQDSQNEDTCTRLVNDALGQMASVCADLDTNTMCLGSEPVSARLTEDELPVEFSQRGDHLSIEDVSLIETGQIDVTQQTWGVDLIHIQANLPQSMVDQGVVLLAAGGMQIDNHVDPETAITLKPAIQATLKSPALLHVSPYPVSNVLATVSKNAEVSTDAISSDQQWVRVVYEGMPGWVNRSVMDEAFDASGLTVLGPDSFTAMQSFYLTDPNLQKPVFGPCKQTPSFVLAQGPTDIPVDIRVEDVPIRIESTVLMNVLPSEDNQCGRLKVTTLYGLATLYPDTERPLLIPPGYFAIVNIPCDEDGKPDAAHPIQAADWSQPELMTETDLEQFQPVTQIAENLLHYPVTLPIIIRASGRTVISYVYFERMEATRKAEEACLRGELSNGICQTLGLRAACGEVVESGLNGFPQLETANCPSDTSVVEAPAWTPVVTEGPTCRDWLVYHTNQTGDWELFRLGDLPDDVSADNANVNLSRGVGPRVYDIAPARSPDQNWIAFMSNRDGNWEIYLSSVTTDEIKRVTYNTTSIERNPTWSPDGKILVYESSRNGNWDLYAFNLVTGVEVQLTSSEGNDIDAYWAPDSVRLVYENDSAGFWQIHEYDLTTMTAHELSDGSGDDHDPKYSNDGQRIAFRSYRDGKNGDIYIMNADGSRPTRISDQAGNALNQVWSPNDELIAYQSSLDGDDDIYVYDVKGGKTRHITDNAIGDYAPTWMCDSTNLAFTSDITSDSNLFATGALPITDPPILVENTTQLTSDPQSDQYPVNSPHEESASEQGGFPSPQKNK